MQVRPFGAKGKTDKSGKFTAQCIPGVTYTVCVNDRQLSSDMIALIPYELDTGKSNTAEMSVAIGNLIEVRVSSGPQRNPMPDTRVYLRQTQHFTWIEGKRT